MKGAPNRTPLSLLQRTHGWRSGPGHLTAASDGTGLGKTRRDLTVVHLSFGTGALCIGPLFA